MTTAKPPAGSTDPAILARVAELLQDVPPLTTEQAQQAATQLRAGLVEARRTREHTDTTEDGAA